MRLDACGSYFLTMEVLMQQANVHEVLQMAIQMELEGQEFYEKHALHATGDVKDTFLRLAADEVKHAELFREMYTDVKENRNLYYYFFVEEVVEFFKNQVKGVVSKRESIQMSTAKEALEEGIVTEKKTIQFYEKLIPFSKPDTTLMLQRIIEEEVNHVKVLIKLLDTI